MDRARQRRAEEPGPEVKYWNDALNELASPAKRELVELEITSRIIGSTGSLYQLENIQSAAEEGDYESIQRSAQAKYEKLNDQEEFGDIRKNYGDLRIDSNAAKRRIFITEHHPKGNWLSLYVGVYGSLTA
jgi:hypothetical protein